MLRGQGQNGLLRDKINIDVVFLNSIGVIEVNRK